MDAKAKACARLDPVPQMPQGERYLRRSELALQLGQKGRLAQLRRPLGFGAPLLGLLLLLLRLGYSVEQPDHAPALASLVTACILLWSARQS